MPQYNLTVGFKSYGREEVILMAKNTGNGYRIGAVKDRCQTYNPQTNTWVKRDSSTGRFIDAKCDGTPFKGVPKYKDDRR